MIEEKRVVTEISNLKKAKIAAAQAIATGSGPTTLEQDKTRLDELRTQLKVWEENIAGLDAKLDAAKAVLTALDFEYKESRGNINELLAQKKVLNAELSAAKDEKSTLYTTFKASQEAYQANEQEQYKLREAAHKEQTKALKEAKVLAMAESELENADVPAFADEIFLCNALAGFLLHIIGEKKEEVASPAAASVGRQVDERDSKPKGATVLSKKNDDEIFMMIGNKKSKKVKKTTGGTVDLAKPVKIDFEMMAQFAKLSIDLPKSIGDIKAAVAALERKKADFLATQATTTATNKKVAKAKVEALRAALSAEEEVETLV